MAVRDDAGLVPHRLNRTPLLDGQRGGSECTPHRATRILMESIRSQSQLLDPGFSMIPYGDIDSNISLLDRNTEKLSYLSALPRCRHL